LKDSLKNGSFIVKSISHTWCLDWIWVH